MLPVLSNFLYLKVSIGELLCPLLYSYWRWFWYTRPYCVSNLTLVFFSGDQSIQVCTLYSAFIMMSYLITGKWHLQNMGSKINAWKSLIMLSFISQFRMHPDWWIVVVAGSCGFYNYGTDHFLCYGHHLFMPSKPGMPIMQHIRMHEVIEKGKQHWGIRLYNCYCCVVNFFAKMIDWQSQGSWDEAGLLAGTSIIFRMQEKCDCSATSHHWWMCSLKQVSALLWLDVGTSSVGIH